MLPTPSIVYCVYCKYTYACRCCANLLLSTVVAAMLAGVNMQIADFHYICVLYFAIVVTLRHNAPAWSVLIKFLTFALVETGRG